MGFNDEEAKSGLRFSLSPYFDDSQVEDTFQQIENMWRKQGEAIGEIVVPEGVLDTLDDYQFHPAVLDACFQTSKAVQVIDEEALFLPASIGRIQELTESLPTIEQEMKFMTDC